MNFLQAIKKPFRNQSHKSPYNSDFDKKTVATIVDTQAKGGGDGVRVVKTEAGTVRFEGGIATLPDDSRANDIYGELKEKHGIHPMHDQFSLTRHKSQRRDGIHNYKFGQLPGMPYLQYDELGRVIKDK